MGRAPCCDKNNVKKGPWSPEEDAKLKAYIEEHGTGGNWIALPQKIGLKRCGKSCRLRWLNYLRPNIKHGGFSEEEDNIICSLFISIGSRWSIIAAQLPGRTDNDVKNYWNTRLKKKLFGKQRREHGQKSSAAAGGNMSRLKQAEMRRAAAAANPMLMMTTPSPLGSTNTTPASWPELPARYAAAAADNEPSFNDHQSIRNLLVKLGGRFGDNNELAPPLYHESPMNQLPTAMDTLNATNSSPLSISHEYNMEGGQSEELPNLSSENNCFLEQMSYTNNDNIPQKLDGLDFVYDNMFINNNGKLDWSEMMNCYSIAYAPPLLSSYASVIQPPTGLAALQPDTAAALFGEELISYSGTTQ